MTIPSDIVGTGGDACRTFSRRKFLQAVSIAGAGLTLPGCSLRQKTGSTPPAPQRLAQFEYSDVVLATGPHEEQLHQTRRLLMDLNDDSLLKPFRQMSGQPSPGEDLGGWYTYKADYGWGDREGFAPSCHFGQWVSALARMYAISQDPAIREKVLRLNRLYAQTISGDYYEVNRFPTYCYDKIVCGLIDSHKYVRDPDAFAILERTTDTALPHFPGHAVEHDTAWRPNKEKIWTWDESYTISENLFLAYQRGAGERYRELGHQYLLNGYYAPLAEGRNNLAGRHAYSHVNSLSSAMQAWFTLGSRMHLLAATNAHQMLLDQSYATGGWGPDETLRAPGSTDLYDSLTSTHASFETPCGAYAHFKLTRYLLREARDSRYGDSMERVMYNTVLGAKPLMPDGRTFYYSDYNFKGHKFYRDEQHWSCCSGTLPQVAADYRINIYFRDPQGVWVNLYIPSSVSWKHDGSQVQLTQESLYPFDSVVQFKLKVSRPRRFTLNFRIPSWANGASISVNGQRQGTEVTAGAFAAVSREWTTDDRIELELPMAPRLEPIDRQHPNTAALCFGPLALFAITDSQPPLTRDDLLAVKRAGRRSWQVTTASGPLTMLPFTDIGDEQYATYLNVS